MSPSKPIVFTPQRTAITLAAAALFMILGYTIYAAFPLLEGPFLKATVNPSESGTALIQGTTERVSYLEINGAPVPLEENGSFAIERAFPPGYTVITLAAKDRFGRSIVRTLDFLNINATSTSPYGNEKES